MELLSHWNFQKNIYCEHKSVLRAASGADAGRVSRSSFLGQIGELLDQARR